eukprot:TRINITY_DN4946_c0_g1_i2.p1 TRINITY_DN4946_c0_g1~~TRINITY_DN4946_c0_g1_i2.p1  ORF type:complete len:390 (+),score=37.95 TRINITY_DN4946_c0_g1_i2:27-1172(+)
MGKTKDRHVRQERDRGQGWDKKLFPGNPYSLNHFELKEELKKRCLSTIGQTRTLRGRFIRALCVGIPVGGKPRTGLANKLVWFDEPQVDDILCSISPKGVIDYTDLDKPRWTTLRAKEPVPEGKTIEWSFGIEKAYNLVLGVVRDPVDSTLPIGTNDDGWGYFITMATKHHDDEQFSPAEAEQFGVQVKPGDKVSMRMNAQRGTLAFFCNDKPLGVAFRDIYGEVYPALSLCGICIVHCLSWKESTVEDEDDIISSVRLEGETTLPLHKAGECRFVLDTLTLGGDLALVPVAMGVTFDPKPVLVKKGQSISEPVKLTILKGELGSSVSIRVIAKPEPGNRNQISNSYALDDQITIALPMALIEQPSSREGTAEPPEKRTRI